MLFKKIVSQLVPSSRSLDQTWIQKGDLHYLVFFTPIHGCKDFQVAGKIKLKTGEILPAKVSIGLGVSKEKCSDFQKWLEDPDHVTIHVPRMTIELRGQLMGGGGGISTCSAVKTEQDTPNVAYGSMVVLIPPYKRKLGVPLELQLFDKSEKPFLENAGIILIDPTLLVRTQSEVGMAIFRNAYGPDVHLISIVNPPKNRFHFSLASIDSTQSAYLGIRIAMAPGGRASVYEETGKITFDENTVFFGNPKEEHRSYSAVSVKTLLGISEEVTSKRVMGSGRTLLQLLENTKIIVVCQIGHIRTMTLWTASRTDGIRRNISAFVDGSEPSEAEKLSWVSTILGKPHLSDAFNPLHQHHWNSETPLNLDGKNSLKWGSEITYVGLWKNGYPHGPSFLSRSVMDWTFMMWDQGSLVAKHPLDFNGLNDTEPWVIADYITNIDPDVLSHLTTQAALSSWIGSLLLSLQS